jgi:hypothetical protein
MANKYYVIHGNPQITQKNRNRFFARKYLEDLYVIEDNEYGQNWLKDKNYTEKTLEEANAIITASNQSITDALNATRLFERQQKIEQYGPDDETHLEVASGVGAEPNLQDLITEE